MTSSITFKDISIKKAQTQSQTGRIGYDGILRCDVRTAELAFAFAYEFS